MSLRNQYRKIIIDKWETCFIGGKKGKQNYEALYNVTVVVHVRLCDPMNCSMPDFPVLHHVPEFTQTHVHRVGDAIQPSHPLSSLLLLPSVFPSISTLYILLVYMKIYSSQKSIIA